MPALKAESSSSSGSEKKPKKSILPLFGKKRTFGLGKPTLKPMPKVARIENFADDENVEEFDEDEEPNSKGQKKNETKATEKSTSATNVAANNENINENVTVKCPDDTKPDVTEIQSPETMETETETETIDRTVEPEQSTIKVDEPKEKEKKKRNRNRIRHDRNRDANAEYVETEEPAESGKYSKWIPPENQTGDGYTNLNAKYGY